MNKPGNFIATGIGSLPHTDPLSAVNQILTDISEIPFWPQLPMLGLMEGMCGQYIGQLPGIEINYDKSSFSINTTLDHSEEMAVFFQNFLDLNYGYFAIEEKYTAGLYCFLEHAKKTDKMKFVKGHITGPITFGSLIKDEAGKDISHNDVFYDCIVKNLAMKAAWQVELLKRYDLPVIIFMDEPSMSSFGSAYSTLKREDVLSIWNEVIEVIHDAGGLAAIHCCGNTDWGLLFDSKCDIVNFDIEYFEKMMVYTDKLKKFLAEGRKMAWGAVPTDDRIFDQTTESIKAKMDECINKLIDAGISKEDITKNSMITPSCGMGTLDIKTAERITSVTAELSKICNKEYCS